MFKHVSTDSKKYPYTCWQLDTGMVYPHFFKNPVLPLNACSPCKLNKATTVKKQKSSEPAEPTPTQGLAVARLVITVVPNTVVPGSGALNQGSALIPGLWGKI